MHCLGLALVLHMHAMTIFSNWVSSLKQLLQNSFNTTKYRPQQSLSNSSKSVDTIYPLKPEL